MCKTRFSHLDSFCSPPLKLYTPIILCSIEMVSITFREIIFSQNSLVLIAACSLSQNWCSYSSATANSKAKSSRSWQVKKYIVKEITTRLPAPLHRQLAEKKQQIWGRIWFTLQQVPLLSYIQNRLGKNLRSLLANDKVGPGNSKDLDKQIWSHFLVCSRVYDLRKFGKIDSLQRLWRGIIRGQTLCREVLPA